MIKPHPADDPQVIFPVRVRRHPIRWGPPDPAAPISDWLSDLTCRAIRALGPEIQCGCHFINPLVTVSSMTPSATFFREALNQRGSLLRDLRHEMGNARFRQQAKSLSPSARQAALSGLMFIDGNPSPPRTWQAGADELFKREADTPITLTRRPVDLAAFKASGDPEPLKRMAREALLDTSPGHATFVTPGSTISASAATPAFYEAAKQAQARWCILLNRTLGCGNVRRLRRTSDTATLCLAFGGTLLVDGQVYLPKHWPIHTPKPGRLKKTPFGSPTVPLFYLGLVLPPTRVPEPREDDERAGSEGA